MEKIKFDFAMGKMVQGRLYNANIDKKDTYLLKISNGNMNNMILRVSKTDLKMAEKRSESNP